jgi:hypothetical protein
VGIEHLSAQGRPDPSGGLIVSGVKTKTWTSPIWAFHALKIFKNGRIFRKLQPPKIRGQELKETNHLTYLTKVDSQTLKKFFVCCSVVIRVQKWLVEVQVAFLWHF